MFIYVGTPLRGEAGVKLTLLISNAIITEVFILFQLNLLLIEASIGLRGGGQLSPKKSLERTRFGQIAQVELGKINF